MNQPWGAVIVVLALSVFSFGCRSTGQVKDKPCEIKRAAVESIMRRAADWQLTHPYTNAPLNDWTQGPFLNGLFALGSIPGNEQYLEKVEQIGRDLNWQVVHTVWVANDFCAPQTWLDLYRLKKDPAMLAPTRKALDQNIADNTGADEDVQFLPKNAKKWSWCDSLYMAAPTFARIGSITGDPKYDGFLDKWWWIASKAYYDEGEYLFFRDQNFVKTDGGPKIFWSRGNGWVLGGLVRVLQFLPKDDPMRPRYEQQFREMCERLLELQQPDGLWTANLLDPNSPPGPESSGSAFFIYGLAYGINNGFLPHEDKPAVCKAWLALTRLIKDDGQLTRVQPIGDSPQAFDPNSTKPYGVGAFLLAGSEVLKFSK